jgi:class 3 adenylate cyclase
LRASKFDSDRRSRTRNRPDIGTIRAASPRAVSHRRRSTPHPAGYLGIVSGITRYAKSGDVHIAYQAIGDGPRDVVFVPGWISHVELGWEFPAFAHLLERLASFSRLIIFDKRGTGLSDPVATVPTIEERMADLRALMDAAGSERAVLFGECEGVPLSVVFAAAHPERVDGLVLYGSMPSVVVDPDEPRWIDEAAELRNVVDNWGQGKTIEVFAPTVAGSQADRSSMGEFERAAASPGMACALLESLRDIDVAAAAASVHVPALVLHRRDDYVPIEPARQLAGLIPGARFVELEGRDHALTVGDTEAIVGEIEEFVTGTRQQPAPTRALLTVLFTDIVGSTRLAAELGDARWRTLLDDHNRIVRRLIEEHRGREIKTVGDGFLMTFDGPAGAIWCGRAIVAALRELDIHVRVGIHTGEAELLGDDIGGLAVHIGARVVALAEPDEILVTRTVRDLVAGSGIAFSERGAYELKGVPGEWDLLAVAADSGRPLVASAPSLAG